MLFLQTALAFIIQDNSTKKYLNIGTKGVTGVSDIKEATSLELKKAESGYKIKEVNKDIVLEIPSDAAESDITANTDDPNKNQVWNVNLEENGNYKIVLEELKVFYDESKNKFVTKGDEYSEFKFMNEDGTNYNAKESKVNIDKKIEEKINEKMDEIKKESSNPKEEEEENNEEEESEVNNEVEKELNGKEKVKNINFYYIIKNGKDKHHHHHCSKLNRRHYKPFH